MSRSGVKEGWEWRSHALLTLIDMLELFYSPYNVLELSHQPSLNPPGPDGYTVEFVSLFLTFQRVKRLQQLNDFMSCWALECGILFIRVWNYTTFLFVSKLIFQLIMTAIPTEINSPQQPTSLFKYTNKMQLHRIQYKLLRAHSEPEQRKSSVI